MKCDKYSVLNMKICANVYEKNINAVLFFKSLGFKKIMDKIDEKTHNHLLTFAEKKKKRKL